MNNATATIDGNLVRVSLSETLAPDVELWFCKMLDKWASYIEVKQDTMRLCGYGIYLAKWENFRFWLGVSLMSSGEDEDDEQ